MDIRRVEFTLEDGEWRNDKIKVQKLRGIFPDANVKFNVHTDDGDKTTYIRENGRTVAYFKLGDWFGRRSPDELSGKFAIEVVNSMAEYSLKIITIEKTREVQEERK